MNAKLQEIIFDHGIEGYGLYWYCLELVAQNVSSENLTFELKHDARIIGRNIGLPANRVEEIMKAFIANDLFSASEGRIQCLKLAQRADDFTAKAIRRKPQKTLLNQSVGVSPTNSDKVPLEEEVRSKKKEEEKKNITKRFAPPSLQEATEYFGQRAVAKNILINPNEPEKFVDFYESKNWMVGKNKMKDWKAAVRNWLSNVKPEKQNIIEQSAATNWHEEDLGI